MIIDLSITQDDMYKALSNLNPNKSAGPDQIHPRLLKELATELSYPLFKMFNKSVKDGTVPTAWKLAEVIPLFKKGNKNLANNYRPVSLTSIVCKVFESFIRNAIFKTVIFFLVNIRY